MNGTWRVRLSNGKQHTVNDVDIIQFIEECEDDNLEYVFRDCITREQVTCGGFEPYITHIVYTYDGAEDLLSERKFPKEMS